LEKTGLKYDKQAISVDCVIFGFDGTAIRVLLTRRQRTLPSGEILTDRKLPGSLISDTEDLLHAAIRVTQEVIGGRNVNLRQMEIFSNPRRLRGEELKWLNNYYGVTFSRVVTMAFITFVRLDQRLKNYAIRKGADWATVSEVQRLALDHNRILDTAMDYLMRFFQQEPVAFELLPGKFTITQLQNLYEAVFHTTINNRSFRKMLPPYILPTGESETAASPNPVQYYYFNKRKYKQISKKLLKSVFIY
jgi:ADP-ribose pyrophosphatase YjhB (NUDIX family)